MRIARRDPYRWRHRFALFPRRIGDEWVWLERYAWRPLRALHMFEYKTADGQRWSLEWRAGLRWWRVWERVEKPMSNAEVIAEFNKTIGRTPAPPSALYGDAA